jgi:hypothetical protein
MPKTNQTHVSPKYDFAPTGQCDVDLSQDHGPIVFVDIVLVILSGLTSTTTTATFHPTTTRTSRHTCRVQDGQFPCKWKRSTIQPIQQQQQQNLRQSSPIYYRAKACLRISKPTKINVIKATQALFISGLIHPSPPKLFRRSGYQEGFHQVLLPQFLSCTQPTFTPTVPDANSLLQRLETKARAKPSLCDHTNITTTWSIITITIIHIFH